MLKNVTFTLALLILFVGIINAYESYGHTLGIRQAKFKMGDCIIDVRKNEFRKYTSPKRMVKEVGKSEYLLAQMESDNVIENWRSSSSIGETDTVYQKTECSLSHSRPPKVSSK